MYYKVDLYRKCHQELKNLYELRQIPWEDSEVQNRLKNDGAINLNALSATITEKGEEMFLDKYYLDLSDKVESEKKEEVIKERDSLLNQISIEKADERHKQTLLYQKITIVITSITALVTILNFINGCN